jgi:hypothetical protein
VWPSARSMAATVEESTPPDMATAMVCADMSLSLDALAEGESYSIIGECTLCFLPGRGPVAQHGLAHAIVTAKACTISQLTHRSVEKSAEP